MERISPSFPDVEFDRLTREMFENDMRGISPGQEHVLLEQLTENVENVEEPVTYGSLIQITLENTHEQQDIVEILTSALENIKEEYKRYVAVLHLFDAHALGTMSEAVLAKLLEGQEGIRNVQHVGGGGGLADIVVNETSLSVKTTSSGHSIGLGQDVEILGNVGQVKVSEALTSLNLAGRRYGDVLSILRRGGAEGIAESIEGRIDAIGRKLVGRSPDEPHVFIWVEKVRSKVGEVSELRIHLRDFNEQEFNNIVESSTIKPTNRGWSLVKENRVLVGADAIGKILNIRPALMYATGSDPVISKVRTVVTESSADDTIRRKATVSSKVLSTLDSLYNELYENEDA